MDVKIGNKYMEADFGLVFNHKVISMPSVQTKFVEVPGRDGAIDMTEVLTSRPMYNNRTITMTFTAMPGTDFISLYSQVANHLHGQKKTIIFSDDLNFYYEGRLSIDSWEQNGRVIEITISADCQPFKWDTQTSAEDWDWDTFDFENGIINEGKDVAIAALQTYTLICRGRSKTLAIKSSNSNYVHVNGTTLVTLNAGENVLSNVTLKEGENTLKFAQAGTVTITYRGGTL